MLRAVEAHDLDGLQGLLDRFPELVTARGTNGNDLLGMASATCDERLVAILLQRGADVGQATPTAGRRCTRRSTATCPPWLGCCSTPAPRSMSRPAVRAVLRLWLRCSGQPGDGPSCSPNTCVAGQPAARRRAWPTRADRRAHRPGRGASPLRRRAARVLSASQRVPGWRPTSGDREILDESLSWAARSDRVEALDVLVRVVRRSRPNVYRGTALAWAAACGRTGSIRRLVALGADPDQRTTFGGPDHGEAPQRCTSPPRT